VANGKGILAAGETVPTLTRRLAVLTIESTPQSRRAYREMIFATPGVSDFISGVILQDETIHQEDDNGTPLADLLIRNFGAGQRAFYHRAKCTGAATRARYSPSMETELVVA
jgi:fructose-bisphosphate aldolase class 1